MHTEPRIAEPSLSIYLCRIPCATVCMFTERVNVMKYISSGIIMDFFKTFGYSWKCVLEFYNSRVLTHAKVLSKTPGRAHATANAIKPLVATA